MVSDNVLSIGKGKCPKKYSKCYIIVHRGDLFMRKVNLRMNEQEKFELIKELVYHGGNKKRVALRLGITIRQVNRLIIVYKKQGKEGFIHGNRDIKPANSFSKDLAYDIILLYTGKYQGFNFTHFHEFLVEYEGINVSRKTVYNILTENNILSPKANRKTRRAYIKARLMEENKLSDKSDEEIDEIVDYEIALEDSHPRGEKPKYFGEVIEMDASNHLWFGSKKTHLHLAVDKATNTVLGGFFHHQETLHGYYNVFKQILENYGIPNQFTTDNRTVFNYERINPSKRTSDKDVLTQFGYACKILGVSLKTTSIPQAKGLIERTNGTFQDRLVNELKLYGINDIEKANDYLLNTFIPRHNKRFALDYKSFESVMSESPSEEKINYTLATLTARKIDNGNSIKFKNKYYQTYRENQLICLTPRVEGLVIEAFDGNLVLSINEKIYELKELSRNERFSEEFDKKPEPVKEKKKYIPPMTHPWKIEYYRKQLKKAHTDHVYA